MAESSIPVDLLNPGQVFACLGLLEAADILLGAATATFDWSDGRETRFRVAAEGEEPPVERVMRFLEEARRSLPGVPSQSAERRTLEMASWGAANRKSIRRSTAFPFPDPDSPATLPVVLQDDDWQCDRRSITGEMPRGGTT